MHNFWNAQSGRIHRGYDRLMLKIIRVVNDRLDLISCQDVWKGTVMLHSGNVIIFPVHFQDPLIKETDGSMILIVSLWRQAIKSLRSKKWFNVICCKLGYFLVRCSEKISYCITVSSACRFTQVAFFRFNADGFKISSYMVKPPKLSSINSYIYPLGGALAS